MFVSATTSPIDWSGFTLILPAVSVGNVAQLASDLLISTLGLSQAGYLHDASILPLCGNDPFGGSSGMTKGCLVTSAEVYVSKQQRLVVVQQRTPLVKGKHAIFRRKLLAWVREAKFSRVVLLTSSQSHERTDSQLTGSQFRYLTTPMLDEQLGTTLSAQLQWKRLEKRENQWAPPLGNEEGRPECARGVYIPGGGIARKLFDDCCTDGIPLAVLLLFCSEGDNIPDALSLVTHLNQWLQLAKNCNHLLIESWMAVEMDVWLKDKWIGEVLKDFDRNGETPIPEEQPPIACHVLNIKILDEVIDGIGGLAEVHDNKNYIKALFTQEAITRFQDEQDNTMGAEFTKLHQCVLALTKYYVMTTVRENIEESEVAICIQDFYLNGYQISPGTRRYPLRSVLEHPGVQHDLRRMWRAKYAPDQPDTCCSQESSSPESSSDDEQSLLSQLLEVMHSSSDSQPTPESSSEAEHTDEDSPDSCDSRYPVHAVFRIEVDAPGLDTAAVLERVMESLLEDLMVIKSNRVTECLSDAQERTIVLHLPSDLSELEMDFLEPGEYEALEDARKKFDSLEFWNPGYKTPPFSSSVESLSTVDAVGFVTEPSDGNLAQEEPETLPESQQVEEDTSHWRVRKKLCFQQTVGSSCKKARSSMDTEQDIVVKGHLGFHPSEDSQKVAEGHSSKREHGTEASDEEGVNKDDTSVPNEGLPCSHQANTSEKMSLQDSSADFIESMNKAVDGVPLDSTSEESSMRSDSYSEDAMITLCDCLTPVEAQGKGDESRASSQFQSFVSDANLNDTSLVVSCEVLHEDADVEVEQQVGQVVLEDSAAIQYQAVDSSSNNTAESQGGEMLLILPKEASQLPPPTSELYLAAKSSSETSEESIACQASTATPVSVNTGFITDTCDRNGSGASKTTTGDSESSHTSNEHAREGAELISDCQSSRAISEPIDTAESPKGQGQLPSVSDPSSQRSRPSPRAHAQDSLSSISVKPLCSKMASSGTEPEAAPGDGHPVTRLRSPAVLGSIPTPVYSVTSHQPPKLPQSDSSDPKSTDEMSDVLGDDDQEGRSSDLTNVKVEEAVLDLCASYFENLFRDH